MGVEPGVDDAEVEDASSICLGRYDGDGDADADGDGAVWTLN